MTAPATSDVLRLCFFGDGRPSLANRLAVLAAWGITSVVFFFNAFFRQLLEDGNLLLRGVGTLVLSVPLLWLYVRGRSTLARRET